VTVRFGVEQVTPEVTVSNRTASVRYNETLVVNGSVAAGGVGVPSVPVVASVGGVSVASGRTGPNGSFGVAGRLPANVSNGSQSVRVRVVPANATRNGSGSGSLGGGVFGAGSAASGALAPANDSDARLAVASASASTDLTVATTPTRTSITATRTVNGTAFVAGTLQTRGGAPLPNQTVALRIGGRTVGRAVTNETGGFATAVGIPDSVGNDSSVSVAAVHSSEEGNLGPSSAQGTLTVGSPGGPVSGRLLRFGALGLLTVAVLGGVGWWARSSADIPADFDAFEDDDAAVDEESESVEGAGNDEAVGEFSDVRDRAATLLDAANGALDAGDHDEAVVAAYGAVRRELAGDGIADPERPRTHWEFFAACREAGVADETLRRLEDLTETYERAAFADGSVSAADARGAVTTAESLGAAA
jgi:hypothetical protein